MKYIIIVSSIFLCMSPLYGQHEHMMAAGMAEMNEAMTGMYGAYPQAREASGTSWQPDSSPLEGLQWMRDDWMFMAHGSVTGIYDDQRGKRGQEESFSSSMFMFMAMHPLSTGTFGVRSMFSLDPLMGNNGYPLLLQTGETADGKTHLLDRQHPHDLFMELACTYSVPVSQESSLFAYLGLPGEPALGPPAFMHRFSGKDFPSAPIMHHWLDSTHITYGVVTAGYVWKDLKLEGSLFRGREPDQDRWDIESPKLDSAAARVSFNPAKDWALQASFGYIDSPEQLAPRLDTRRTTASVMYNRPFAHANWQTTFSWGRNDNLPGKMLDGFLLESAVTIQETHTFFSRFERVEKDELFPEEDPLHEESFTVNKVTVGYVYDFPAWQHMRWGIGGSLDVNILPATLESSYGNTPLGYMLFVRLALD